MKFKIFKYESVASTNNIAIDLIKEKKKESGFVYADEQTKGKGTHGKKWVSNKGNLFGSIFFPLKKDYPSFSEFSIINSIIISDIIKLFCEKEKINLKFPNDIFVNRRKICGILQELITLKDRKFLIIGIGLNIVTNPNIKNRYKATNILAESKKKPKIKDIIDLIVITYENFFVDLNSYKYLDFKRKAETMVMN